MKKITQENCNFKFSKDIEEMSSVDIYACYQCGICSGICPISFIDAMDFTPRQILRMTQLGMTDEVLSSETLWMCTSCWKCYMRCPREIDFSNTVRALRGLIVDEGHISRTVQDALTNSYRYGNPWGGLEKRRTEWAKDLEVKDISKPTSKRSGVQKVGGMNV